MSWWEAPSAQMQGLAGRLWEGVGVRGGLRQPLCSLLTQPPPPPPGSPLQFYVDAINSRHVSAYGPGLSHGMVNKPATFTIVTKDAGEGEASSGRGWGRAAGQG